MPAPAPEPLASPRSVLELTVRNHPGVMSHVCGLFSRRGYNVEGILCMPVGDGARSRVWLLVNEDARLDQMIKQLLEGHEKIIGQIRPKIEESEKVNDEGTADLLIQHLRFHEKTAWMLRSHFKEVF